MPEYARTYLDVISGLVWHDSHHISALSDDERHFGHAVHMRGWHAFDATRPGLNGEGFAYLGSFPTREAAKQAVQESVNRAAWHRCSMAVN